MQTNNCDSGLGEALASYQPTSLPTATWERFRTDALDLVARLNLRDGYSARKCLSRLTAFLADLAEVRPEASLADLLTREQVDGHLQRALQAGIPAGTVQNRQGTLNALLRVRHGHRQHASRQPERHLAPYDRDELDTVLAAAVVDGSAAAADLARTIVCGLAGHPLPTRRRPVRVRVEVDGATATAGQHAYRFAPGTALPASGDLDAGAVQRAREWAVQQHGFRLDVRRLALTRLAELVATRPAVEVLQIDGLGRDRLTAAVAAAGPIPPDVLRGLLRFADRPTTREGRSAHGRGRLECPAKQAPHR